MRGPSLGPTDFVDVKFLERLLRRPTAMIQERADAAPDAAESPEGADGDRVRAAKGEVDECLRAVLAARDDVVGAKSKAEECLESLSTVGEEAAAAKAKVDECLDSVSGVRKQAEEATNAISEFHTQASQTAKKLDEVETEARTHSTAITTTASQIDALLAKAKKDQAATSELAAKAMTLDAKIATQSNRMEALTEACDELKGKIESLLPGATSTGLAKSFMDRKSAFRRPKLGWGALAVGSIVMLCLVGLIGETGFLAFAKKDAVSFPDILRGLLWRLPVVLPLVWLAIFGGKHFFLASRIEEDYAYKEAVSRSFEGYKREMQGIPAGATGGTPLEILCTNVLSAMATPPGRLFDKKQHDFTPLSLLVDALDAKALAALGQKFSLPPERIRELLLSVAAMAPKRGK